ncbi:MAG: glycosyltransferase [Hyphomicrobiales bacterium]|nr:MAG: glycosyltransferase [Hyphomicrobiales bacterium]
MPPTNILLRDEALVGSSTEAKAPRPDRPTVSVIVANYNGERTIGATLASLLGQSLSALEIIVVDDASSDASCAIVRQLQQRDPRVRLIASAANGGPARARNRALDAARGEWIAIVDADDLVHPERFERLVAAAGQLDADIVADDLLFFYEDGTPSSLLLPSGQEGAFEITPTSWVLAGRSVGPPLGYLKPLVRSHWLATLRYDETLGIGEDFDLILRLLLDGARMQVVAEPWYLYRRHAASYSHRQSATHIEAMIESQRRLERSLSPVPPALAEAFRARQRDLENFLAFQHLVAALKGRNLARASRMILTKPALLLPLAKAFGEHVAARRGAVPVSSRAATPEPPAYVPAHIAQWGGESRRRLWLRFADLVDDGDNGSRGVASAYAAGFRHRAWRDRPKPDVMSP